MSSVNFSHFGENNNTTFDNFSSFSEINSTSTLDNFSRTFEQIVTERNKVVSRNDDYYSQLFEKINSKLRTMETNIDVNVFDCEIVKQHIENIRDLKKSVCTVYMEYIDVDTKLNEAKTKYLKFSESIKECLGYLYGINDHESDETIKTLLEDKIDVYYEQLKIDELLKDYTKKYEEFEKTKYKISIMTGVILPTTICQICMENQVDYFIDPCGHTICKLCKSLCENKSNKCHYCRTTRNTYKRIYL